MSIAVKKRVSKAVAAKQELHAAANGKTYRVEVAGKETAVPAGWVPSTVLQQVAGWRYSARLHDLKEKEGIEYGSERLSGNIWIFRLENV